MDLQNPSIIGMMWHKVSFLSVRKLVRIESFPTPRFVATPRLKNPVFPTILQLPYYVPFQIKNYWKSLILLNTPLARSSVVSLAWLQWLQLKVWSGLDGLLLQFLLLCFVFLRVALEIFSNEQTT